MADLGQMRAGKLTVEIDAELGGWRGHIKGRSGWIARAYTSAISVLERALMLLTREEKQHADAATIEAVKEAVKEQIKALGGTVD